jgi:hypothetical protein
MEKGAVGRVNRPDNKGDNPLLDTAGVRSASVCNIYLGLDALFSIIAT